jgi:hypothetical protein
LALHRDGGFSEVFNGPGRVAWEASGAMEKNGQRPISVRKLQKLMTQVSEDGRTVRLLG